MAFLSRDLPQHVGQEIVDRGGVEQRQSVDAPRNDRGQWSSRDWKDGVVRSMNLKDRNVSRWRARTPAVRCAESPSLEGRVGTCETTEPSVDSARQKRPADRRQSGGESPQNVRSETSGRTEPSPASWEGIGRAGAADQNAAECAKVGGHLQSNKAAERGPSDQTGAAWIELDRHSSGVVRQRLSRFRGDPAADAEVGECCDLSVEQSFVGSQPGQEENGNVVLHSLVPLERF